MSEMVKKRASISFGAFPNAEEFLLWVATFHGRNVSETCRSRLEEASTAGKSIDAIEDILNPLIRATRRIDLAKNNFRAQFGW